MTLPTATHYDPSLVAQPKTDAPLPSGLRKVLIIGGGSAGWMTAMLFAHALIGRGAEITVIESPSVGTIGVGEGSTPWLRGFFDGLGIEEAEWMPACNATYKCGISFDGWSTRAGFESYFHPFASMLDNLTLTQFVHNAQARVNGADVHAHPNRFFVAAELARRRRAPKADENFPFDLAYGYHFDAALIGQFLRGKALARGVRHLERHVTQASVNGQGRIDAVHTREGERFEADFFVDCSGFAALLIEKALGTRYCSFKANLFNDAAVALPTPMAAAVPSQTLSTALRHGWAWQIPLTSRFGNGYVYSSAHCSADEAERELRERLGMLDSSEPARHLTMRTGRVEKHWSGNCLAVGLSQGFIEPLEATALLFVQRTATSFLVYAQDGDLGEAAQSRFNAQLNAQFEGTRDYIVTHYKTNSRSDTDYWRDNASHPNISDALHELYATWMAGKSLMPGLGAQRFGQGYPLFSWYCLMSGMGIFPKPERLRPPDATQGRYRMDQIDDFIARSALNYRDHAELLRQIPPRRREPSLQVYFW